MVADIGVPDADFPVLEVPGKEVDPGGSGGPEAIERGGAPGGGGGGPEAIERGGAPGGGGGGNRTEIASGRVGLGGRPAGRVEGYPRPDEAPRNNIGLGLGSIGISPASS